jgi:uncharacterized protein involved in type VI secretion and phage assembly
VASGRDNGLVVGVVDDLDDPESLGRVRVKLPHLDNELSDWAPLVSPMGGKDRGVVFRPEPDDTVLVAFELGDPRRPYVLGAFWSKPDPPPALGDPAKENNLRLIRSRSGHVIRLDDTDGSERIEIVDAKERLKVTLDTAANEIAVTADGGTVRVEASTVKITATSTAEISANGKLTLKGQTVEINP